MARVTPLRQAERHFLLPELPAGRFAAPWRSRELTAVVPASSPSRAISIPWNTHLDGRRVSVTGRELGHCGDGSPLITAPHGLLYVATHRRLRERSGGPGTGTARAVRAQLAHAEHRYAWCVGALADRSAEWFDQGRWP